MGRKVDRSAKRLGRTAGIWAVAMALVVASCSSTDKSAEKDYARALPPGAKALELVTDPSEYPDFDQMFDDRQSTLAALEQSLLFFSKPSSQTHYPFDEFTHDRVVQSLEHLAAVLRKATTPEQLNGYMHLDFDVYRSVGWDGSGTVLYTAYCEPIFDGSLRRTERFRWPLYRLPDDLVKDKDGTPRGQRQPDGSIRPYPTRREIEEGGLLEGSELVWLSDRFDAFVAHVQGSARVNLSDGRQMCIGYAGKTDRPYTSVGKALIADDVVDKNKMSLSTIRRYFRDNPGAMDVYLPKNESFVFFTETPPGPFGSIGSKVTAYRTVATDKSIFPRGALCAAETTVVELTDNGAVVPRPFSSFVFDQDTGGAIRSAGRADLFVGTGSQAERIAGHVQHEGKLFYLFLKEAKTTSEGGGMSTSGK